MVGLLVSCCRGGLVQYRAQSLTVPNDCCWFPSILLLLLLLLLSQFVQVVQCNPATFSPMLRRTTGCGPVSVFLCLLQADIVSRRMNRLSWFFACFAHPLTYTTVCILLCLNWQNIRIWLSDYVDVSQNLLISGIQLQYPGLEALTD